MKFKWTNIHTSILCIILLAALGSFMLYLKLRRFRHYIDEDIENEPTKTAKDMQAPDPAYDTKVRGYRNNNPLNIRISNNNWKGEIKPSTDGSFCQFQTMAHGFRAAMCCIRTYIRVRGCKTLQEIINRWAPVKDGNNPVRYCERVMNSFPEIFTDKEMVIDYKNKEQMTHLVYAMAIVENGSEPVMTDCIKAFSMM